MYTILPVDTLVTYASGSTDVDRGSTALGVCPGGASSTGFLAVLVVARYLVIWPGPSAESPRYPSDG